MIRRLFRSIRPRAAAYFRRRLLARGIDRTEQASTGRALVLAPHPDDEALGCGALIARKAAAGTEVAIVIATDGRNGERAQTIGAEELARVRHEEALSAAEALGLTRDAVRFLDLVDGSLDANRAELSAQIATIEAEFNPDEIYAPHADQHPDHRTLSEVARTTFVGTTQAKYFEYPIRYWGRVPWVTRSPSRLRAIGEIVLDPIREWRRPPAMLVRTEEHLAAKLAATEVYAGEMAVIGHIVQRFLRSPYEAYFPIER